MITAAYRKHYLKVKSAVRRQGPPKVRITQDERDVMRAMFLAYEPMEVIARQVDRDIPTTRQTIFHMGLRRNPAVSRLLQSAPDLRPVLLEQGPEAFVRAVHTKRKLYHNQAIRDAQRRRKELVAKACAAVLPQDISRNDKIRALRAAGLRLQEIAVMFSVTRERVRQLCDPEHRAKRSAAGKARYRKRVGRPVREYRRRSIENQTWRYVSAWETQAE